MRTAVLVLALMAGCASSAERRQPEQRTLRSGNAAQSANRKTSDNRPRVGQEEQNPLQADRFGTEELIVRTRGEHASEHSQQALAQEAFSHPACASLSAEERRACPILRASWSSLVLVSGGAELGLRGATEPPERLRFRLLCHIAYGQVVSGEDGCPLHVPQVRISVTQAQGGGVVVRIVTDDPRRVDRLRQQLKQLISPSSR